MIALTPSLVKQNSNTGENHKLTEQKEPTHKNKTVQKKTFFLKMQLC